MAQYLKSAAVAISRSVGNQPKDGEFDSPFVIDDYWGLQFRGQAMPMTALRSNRTKTRFVPAVLAFLCLSDGFLFMDSWHRHGKGTFMFGIIFTLSGLLMLAAIFLLKKR